MAQDLFKLTKLHVALPNHRFLDGESFWAQPLGNDLYELRNVPFAAYGLNYLDVVHATSDSNPRHKPEIDRVVRRSGRTTFRLLFLGTPSPQQQHKFLAPLRALGISGERGGKFFYAMDVSPQIDQTNVLRHLDALRDAGVVLYESCQEITPGSFDAAPRESTQVTTQRVLGRRSLHRGPTRSPH